MTQTPECQALPEVPDSILAELWEVKREINKAGDYRIDSLVDMANEAAEQVRVQWRQAENRTAQQVNRQRPNTWSGADCAELADLAEEIHGFIGWPASKKKQARKDQIAAIRAKA